MIERQIKEDFIEKDSIVNKILIRSLVLKYVGYIFWCMFRQFIFCYII